MERNDAACGNGNFLAGFRVAPGPLRLVAQLKIAKTGKFDTPAIFQCLANFVEEELHHVLGFTLVETHLLEQQIGKFRFG